MIRLLADGVAKRLPRSLVLWNPPQALPVAVHVTSNKRNAVQSATAQQHTSSKHIDSQLNCCGDFPTPELEVAGAKRSMRQPEARWGFEHTCASKQQQTAANKNKQQQNQLTPNL